MTRLILCVALVCSNGVLSDLNKEVQKTDDEVLAQKQYDLIHLYYHIHEPTHIESCKVISNTWNLEKNIELFDNATAVQTYVDMLRHKWILPKAVPFSELQPEHLFEAVTLFNVLFSAKDFDTFYKTAVFVRYRVNEYLFAHVLNVVTLYREDTQGIFIPHNYDVFPSFFVNGEIMTSAQRINTHGYNYIEHYPTTYKWKDNIVIKRNYTAWPYTYYSNNIDNIFYFTLDYGLNTVYYNLNYAYPKWLDGKNTLLTKKRRGEWFWFMHKQIISRYYMERLSNGLGEIPDITEIVEDGFSSGLLYHNGIPFPVRPNYFHLNNPLIVEEVNKIYNYENRIRNSIDQGFIVNDAGERVSLRMPEAIEVLGRVIEAGVDSPNVQYYKDFVSIWKKVLGNSITNKYHYHNNVVPLVLPSALEHYQTALRDPAFYSIWKRVLRIFQQWQEYLPLYKREELALPQVTVRKVEVDKLMTFFQQSYMNISSSLHSTEEEAKEVCDKVAVLVQFPRLNHEVFQVRVHVTSEVAKTVVVRFFIAPKYDNNGYEIPLNINSQNFYQLDEFIQEIPTGKSIITRDSTDNAFGAKDWPSGAEIYANLLNVLDGKEKFNRFDSVYKMPQRLLLPKGRVGGVPFVFMVYLSEYRKPSADYKPDPIDPVAKFVTADPLGFPLNRPLYNWQIEGLDNLVLKDVLIYHKPTPDVIVPHMR